MKKFSKIAEAAKWTTEESFERALYEVKKITSDKDFKDWARKVLENAFKDKFDEKKYNAVVDGLIKKYKDNYGAMVGALSHGLSETLNENTDTDINKNDKFFVYSVGGMIGDKHSNYIPKIRGSLVKSFNDLDKAKDYTKRLRSQLSKGEKLYYGLNYKVISADKIKKELLKLNESILNEDKDITIKIKWQSNTLDNNNVSNILINWIKKHHIKIVANNANKKDSNMILSGSIKSLKEFHQKWYNNKQTDEEWIESVKESLIYEAKITSDKEFKEYVETVLKNAFQDKYDEKKADAVANGLIKKYKDNYGAMIGALQHGLAEEEIIKERKTTSQFTKVKEINDIIDNFLEYLYDNNDEKTVKKTAKEIINNINYMIDNM